MTPRPLPWLTPGTPFPSPELAPADGLLAAGHELTTERLELAYAQGIFPWFSPGEPVLWWSPDPRMVLRCADFRPSHSLRKTLRRLARDDATPDAAVQVRVDTAFADVMAACAASAPGRESTWITPAIQDTYLQWHRAGRAHSIETWIDGRLAGGLYGVGMGRMFFGESMFSRASDASKIALAYLVAHLLAGGVDLIDCQQQTRHLASLGAAPVPRAAFLGLVRERVAQPGPTWQAGRLRLDGRLAAPAPMTP